MKFTVDHARKLGIVSGCPECRNVELFTDQFPEGVMVNEVGLLHTFSKLRMYGVTCAIQKIPHIKEGLLNAGERCAETKMYGKLQRNCCTYYNDLEYSQNLKEEFLEEVKQAVKYLNTLNI